MAHTSGPAREAFGPRRLQDRNTSRKLKKMPPPRTNSPRLVDVAAHAGTSTAVVSYVINDGPRGVAPATKARVLAAIRDLGYSPNRAARALRLGRTGQIGLIIPSTTAALFSELAAAVESAAFDRGVLTLTGNTEHDRDRELDYAGSFLTAGVDGLVIASVGSTGVGGLAEAASVPVAYINRRPSRSAGILVDVDNQAGATAAVRHLLDHGLDTIVCVSGLKPVGPVRLREKGWRSAIEAAGIDPVTQHVFRTEYRRNMVHEVMASWLRKERPGPVGVFATTDEQAIGVLAAAAREGLRSPHDLRIVSFDGTTAAAYMTPSLTTVAMPIEEMAATAVTSIVEDTGSQEPGRRRFETHLRTGASCGCEPSPLPSTPSPR